MEMNVKAPSGWHGAWDWISWLGGTNLHHRHGVALQVARGVQAGQDASGDVVQQLGGVLD